MSDIVRVGYISAINYADGTAQVTYKDRDNAVSPYMPFASNEFFPPDIDSLVYVIHLQNGGTRGMILPPPYTDGNRPPEGKKGIWRKDFGDGSYLRYDYGSKTLDIVTDTAKFENISVSGDLTVSGSIKAEGSVSASSISSKTIKTTGNVDIGGNLTVAGSYPT
jgi:phage baseplate assembly protein gpV